MNPTDADVGTEVSGNGYTRMQIIFSAPSNGAATNASAVTFPTATGAWGTITHVGIRDALTAGNLLFHGALSVPKIMSSATDVFRFEAGSLTVTLS